MRITSGLQVSQYRNNQSSNISYSQSPLAKYNLKQDTVHFGSFGKPLQDVVYNRSKVVYTDFFAEKLDADDIQFNKDANIKGKAATGELTAKENFSAGSLYTNGCSATFEKDAFIGNEAVTGMLTAKENFIAGNLDTLDSDATFEKNAFIKDNVNTAELTAKGNFIADNLNTNGGRAIFEKNAFIKGKANTGRLVVKGDFSTGSLDTGAESATFEKDVNIKDSMHVGSLKTAPSSNLTAKEIELYVDDSSILGNLNTEKIQTRVNLTLDKIKNLDEIIIQPKNNENSSDFIEKTLKFNSTEIAPKEINVKLGDIHRINIEVPDESVFEKLVFHVMDDAKRQWKKLSAMEVESFIKTANIKKVIKTVV